jgi:hypothetical protein
MPTLPPLESLNILGVAYRLIYSDAKVVLKTFPNEKEAQWYIHNEGDHLLEANKIK